MSRNNDPIEDHEAHVREQALQDSRTFTLRIDDVLATSYIEVGGIEYDTHATAYLCKHGEAGAIDVTSLECRSFYVIVPRSIGGTESIPIDLEHFSKRMRLEVERAIEAEAIRQAELSHKWEAIDED